RRQRGFQGSQRWIDVLFGHTTPNLSRNADSPATYQRWAVLADEPVNAEICSNVKPPQIWATITSLCWTGGFSRAAVAVSTSSDWSSEGTNQAGTRAAARFSWRCRRLACRAVLMAPWRTTQ